MIPMIGDSSLKIGIRRTFLEGMVLLLKMLAGLSNCTDVVMDVSGCIVLGVAREIHLQI